MPGRAAIVIGVDRTGGLPELAAAAKGAKQVGKWLAEDGYTVIELTDANGGKVSFDDVFGAVESTLKKSRPDSLVIYFAGHGYFSVGTEIWLLSGAPTNANAAVNLEASKIAAYACGAKNVVFIADTCRSTPQTPEANAVRGGIIFPVKNSATEAQIDTFFATLVGDAAVEVAADAERTDYNGLFTQTLFDVHKLAPKESLVEIDRNGSLVTVLPNRRLRTVLPNAFAAKVDALRAVISQTPALRIESDEPFHLARAFAASAPPVAERGGVAGVNPTPYSSGTQAVGAIFKAARSLISNGTIPALPVVTKPSDNRKELQLAQEARIYRAAEPQGGFETRCGVLVSGTSIVEAVSLGGIFGEIEQPGQPDNRYRVCKAPGDYSPNDRYGSVIIRFAEGTGTVLAAIPNFVASVIVKDGGVMGVSYSPAPNSPLWGEYQWSKDQAEERRAIAATAARHGILALDREEARKFADLVRVGKSFDPTLGIYAALAYAGVGLRRDALSVLGYMQVDLRANLLDVWLFAGADDGERMKLPLLPLCPMLSQAWNYLTPMSFAVDPVLHSAARCETLWTTFTSEAMMAILDAARAGTLRANLTPEAKSGPFGSANSGEL